MVEEGDEFIKMKLQVSLRSLILNLSLKTLLSSTALEIYIDCDQA
jgi:hypothetical protein